MSRTARERRDIAGAIEVATIRAATTDEALADVSAALSAAMAHITTLEQENDKLRQLVVDLVAIKRGAAA